MMLPLKSISVLGVAVLVASPAIATPLDAHTQQAHVACTTKYRVTVTEHVNYRHTTVVTTTVPCNGCVLTTVPVPVPIPTTKAMGRYQTLTSTKVECRETSNVNACESVDCLAGHICHVYGGKPVCVAIHNSPELRAEKQDIYRRDDQDQSQGEEPQGFGAVRCGSTICPASQRCCNASCGICTLPDEACTKQICTNGGLPGSDPSSPIAYPVPGPIRCGKNTCVAGQVCCNSSCGICTPPKGACIQIYCEDGQLPGPRLPPVRGDLGQS